MRGGGEPQEMKKHSGRLVLWLLAVVVSFLLLQKGHRISPLEETVAFLPGGSAKSGGVIIRLEGNLAKPGIYHFDNEVTVGTVTKMTVPFLVNHSSTNCAFKNILYSGDVLNIHLDNAEHTEITRYIMSVQEKMILGIPLDPNNMTAGEWERLPGIGPSLARKIIVDRQINGGYLTIHDIERVPGIGAAKVRQVERFFE
jgi:competence protein ComEA